MEETLGDDFIYRSGGKRKGAQKDRNLGSICIWGFRKKVREVIKEIVKAR